MAFPAAHFSLAWGIATALGQKLTNYKRLLFWSLVSISPDFDFFFVFVLGFEWRQYHRTFTHSIVFTLVSSALIFVVGNRMGRLKGARSWLAVFLVIFSHLALDFFCVSNYRRDGEMLLWPFSYQTMGYMSFLVPLYRRVGGDPESFLKVAVPYTLLEIVLWSPVTLLAFWKQAARNSMQKNRSASASERGDPCKWAFETTSKPRPDKESVPNE